jgi:L-alanine-DL-glutamate epimerase-like enolase superfamily enzyme
MRVISLETLPFSVPLAPPPGGRGHPLGAGFLTYCLVRVETDSGHVGWGEISDGWGCEYAEVATALVREALARFVLDQDPGEVPTLVQRMWAWMRRRQGTVWLVAQAISGVEIALWDVVGKIRGESVSALIGPAIRTAIPVYASGNFLSQGDADVHAAFFEPALERGVAGVKVRLGPNWRPELEVLDGLCQRLPDGVWVGIDGNEAFRPKTAGRIADALGGLGIAFFEEPVPRTDAGALARLVEQSPVSIAYGEHVHTLDGFRTLGDQRLADIWQPDVTVVGGLVEGRAIGALAAAQGIPYSPHSATSPLGVAANMHAAATATSLTAMEYSAGSIQALSSMFEGGETLTFECIENGALPLPSSPGLGLEPRVDDIRATYPYQPPWKINTLPALYTGTA